MQTHGFVKVNLKNLNLGQTEVEKHKICVLRKTAQ